MNCEEFKDAVVDAVRGQPSNGVVEHAAICAACALYQEQQRSVSAALAALAVEMANDEPGPAVEYRLMKAFERQARHRPLRAGVWWKWAGVAACLLVALALLRVDPGGKTHRRQKSAETMFYALPGMPLDVDTSARVIRVRLPRAELQRLGLSMAGRSDSVDADVLVGGDGLPRAVRPVVLDEFKTQE